MSNHLSHGVTGRHDQYQRQASVRLSGCCSTVMRLSLLMWVSTTTRCNPVQPDFLSNAEISEMRSKSTDDWSNVNIYNKLKSSRRDQ